MTGGRALDEKFIDMVTDNLLTQLVDKPTRLENILDLALVGDPDSVRVSGMEPMA